MSAETSQFESSEMLGAFLASTPLVEESWRLCSRANADARRSFTVKVVRQVSYVAFSGVQAVALCRDMVELDEKVFGSFSRIVEGKGGVMVDAALLQLFLSFYGCLDFQQKMVEILKQSKAVVFSGHSVGGAIASLSSLWLLSYLRTAAAPPHHSAVSVFCITYGSPMLGNQSFSQAILRERWEGNFCHVVAPYDLLPRLLSPPLVSDDRLRLLFHFWHTSMMTSPPPYLMQPNNCQLSDEEKARLFDDVVAGLRRRDDGETYWPFGSYVFCSDKGAVCLDNAAAVVEFLYLTLMAAAAAAAADESSSPARTSIEDHLKYEDYVPKLCCHYFKRRSLSAAASSAHHCDSNDEAGIALALHTLGISSHQQWAYGTATTCLATARQLGWPRNLNSAKMAVSLAKINPCRAELEWYKKYCDDSDDQLGYYDSYKRRGASRREFRVNMNRLKLARFWDSLIEKHETNQLTRDFHKLPKYVNASNYYRLLVEPLEIAEYYRAGKHRERGHYIEHGREKRFEIFEKWWGESVCRDDESMQRRSKYANLTQDSCFWARVEAAVCLVYDVVGEEDEGRRSALLNEIEEFERYAGGMIERMEVSVDVLAKNSSYNLFRRKWGELQAQLQLQLPPPPQPPRFQDGG